jgi:hypothetical protein
MNCGMILTWELKCSEVDIFLCNRLDQKCLSGCSGIEVGHERGEDGNSRSNCRVLVNHIKPFNMSEHTKTFQVVISEFLQNRRDLAFKVFCFLYEGKVNFTIRHTWAGIAQSVYRLATGWTVRGSNPGGGKIFRTLPDRSWGPPSLLYNGYRVFPGGKAAEAWRWPPTTI